MLAKEIKSGSVVNYQGSPVLIQTVAVQTPSARGAATLYKFRGRNLVTRQKQDFVLRGTESIEEADFERRSVKLMYIDSVALHLMDSGDYNQYSISLEEVTGERPYITEQLDGILALLLQWRVRRPATSDDDRTGNHHNRSGSEGRFSHQADQTCNAGNRTRSPRPGIPQKWRTN